MDRKLKVLMLNGSPRENGNIALAFHEMEQVFDECGVGYENILLGRQVVRGCVACESCRKDLDRGSIAVALVTGGLFAEAAQRSQRRLALDEVFEDLDRVGAGVAVDVDHPPRRQLLAGAAVDFDLASLGDAGGAVSVW